MASTFSVLLWKQYQTRRSHLTSVIFSLLLPAIIFGLLNYVSASVANFYYENKKSFQPYMELEPTENANLSEQIGVVLYEPDKEFVSNLMKKAANYIGIPEKSVRAGQIKNASDFRFGVEFHGVSDSSTPDNLNYTIYPRHFIWLQLHTTPSEWTSPGINYSDHDDATLLLRLQVAVDRAFLSAKGVEIKEMVNITQMRRQSLLPNKRITEVISYGPLVFLLVMSVCVSSICDEKHEGAKELMIMMGVKKWQLWLAKLIDLVLSYLATISIALIFLRIPLQENSFVITHVNFLIVWALFAYGIFSFVVFLFFVSCLFNNPTWASFFSSLTVAGTYFAHLYVDDRSSRTIHILLQLFPSLAIMNGFSLLLNFEYLERSVSFNEILPGQKVTFAEILGMLAVDLVIYCLFMWYLDAVNPGRFGIPQPLCFCFSKSYWSQGANDVDTAATAQQQYSDRFEAVPHRLIPGISAYNLTKKFKEYGKGSVLAVDNVNIHFYRGEISSLLGHNGAGKTTTLSMITGMLNPSSGRVIIHGYDLAKNRKQARRSLGLCPQHDMLFRDLSAFQTLKFYGMIKGLSRVQADFEANELLTRLKMQHVKTTKGTLLSGGQKRKLSLAIAMIGGSEVLVLDEPTSGMDPEIRREIWEMLLALRTSKTIILTTHYMEEADVLSDRIAIMDHGVIQCYGTPMYLKSKFGKGYTLAVVISSKVATGQITTFIQQQIPSALFKSQNAMTLSYELPEKSSQAFPVLLAGLEDKKMKGEINSYNISISTLEDVFLKVGGSQLDKDGTSYHYPRLELGEENADDVGVHCMLSIFYTHLYALYAKKMIYFLRNFHIYLLLCILSVGLTINDHFSKEIDSAKSKPEYMIPFSLSSYTSTQVLYTTETGATNDQLELVVKQLGSNSGFVSNIESELERIADEDKSNMSNTRLIALSFSNSAINLKYYVDDIHMPPIVLNLIHLLKLREINSQALILTLLDTSLAKGLEHNNTACLETQMMTLSTFIGLQTMYYVIEPNQEIYYKLKDLQLMSTPLLIYWFCHFTFDLVTLAVFLFFECITIEYVSPDAVEGFRDIEDLFLTLLLWGIGLLALAYFISCLFKRIYAGVTTHLLLHFVIGALGYVFMLIYTLKNMGHDTAMVLPWMAYFHPSLLFRTALLYNCLGSKVDFAKHLGAYGGALILCLLLKECKVLHFILHRILSRFCPISYTIEDAIDADVVAEWKLVRQLDLDDELSSKVLVADGLRRWFMKCCCRKTVAVKDVSFTVGHGECFGLLGVNGAGKTTTFNMLTGALSPSQGSTYANGISLLVPWKRQTYLSLIGYCPQFGGIMPMFHGRELLNLFARLRGVRCCEVGKVVQRWLEDLGLTEYADKQCGKYSGGNMRKLTMGIALIGNPPLLFLDEPTSGVDPVARRILWESIHNARIQGQSVVITSHSMEECEALCTRLAIMVNGYFRCIGDIVTLKNKFGQGYCVQMKISMTATEQDRELMKKVITGIFSPGCDLVDEHFTLLQYRITNPEVTWPRLFQQLEELKRRFSFLESYTATSTSLEQIFISFAKNK